MTARKSFKIHALSKIMILHLKRFSYGNHGSTKLYKPLHFPSELLLSRDLLSSPSPEVIFAGHAFVNVFIFPKYLLISSMGLRVQACFYVSSCIRCPFYLTFRISIFKHEFSLDCDHVAVTH